MSLRNLKLNIKKGKRSTDPMEVFQGLTLRGAIENIWGPRQSALKEWHDRFRDAPDSIIEMNTGGGKTLVGLLIAQSLLNETRGHILYVCPTNQLVEQTIEKAAECGLAVASRYSGDWSNRAQFDAGEAFCVTNYATLFNGQSIFQSITIDAIVFDDAHVAESIIRSQFTIRIGNDTELFKKVLNIYRPHFANSCQSSQYEDACNGKWDSLVFVPMFIAKKHAQELRKLLVESGIHEAEDNKYPWEHLKNRIDVCCVFVSGSGIQITPSVIPLHVMPYFGSCPDLSWRCGGYSEVNPTHS
jgi:Rad3-related DNA helicase